MLNSDIMVVNNKFRRLCEGCNPEALTILKEYGIGNHSKIEIIRDGTTYEGELLVLGEDPENKPVIWFRGRSKRLTPISKADMIINKY